MRARLILPGLMAATALTLASCGAQDNVSSQGAADTARPAASGSSASAGAQPGTSAGPRGAAIHRHDRGRPAFDAATLAGKSTVLWFWAPWCPTCKAQGTETARVATQCQGKANVIGVAGLDKSQAMRDFVTNTRVGAFPNLSNKAGEIWKKFKITQQSFYVILEKDGKTAFTGNLPAGKGLADKLTPLVG
ncbi:redoxin domain-containing protein [Streptomyces sp. H27-H1]|uniref:redoxin domain-containing protein n=1 Tax=Streptomyces sp. H27-H1 TaxID=2996461 RepID=UPI00226E7176|nr:redoxin domain-containing protein [Streptomyces sp. H27-H1]MCY0931501.1 redoxin domain-containing protein [Streptomyces sp. H27-H1]